VKSENKPWQREGEENPNGESKTQEKGEAALTEAMGEGWGQKIATNGIISLMSVTPLKSGQGEKQVEVNVQSWGENWGKFREKGEEKTGRGNED